MTQAPIGIDLGGTKLLINCNDREQRFPTGKDFTPDDIKEIVFRFMQENDISPVGIGIAVPAFVDKEGRVGMCDVLPHFSNWTPEETFSELSCPVIAVNDVNAAAAEEFHNLPTGKTVGIIMVGTAIGASFITEGNTLQGAAGLAGELGYMPMQTPEGIKRLDELAGGSFIAEKLCISGEELAKRGNLADDEVCAAIRAGGEALGLAVASLVNILNPEQLVFGGGTISLPGYFEAMVESARKHSIPEMWESCSLSLVKSGGSVAALGAIRILEKP